MKKILYTLLLFSLSLSYSQTKVTPDEHWSAYAISVQPQNEETVFNIIDEYFSEYKLDDIKVMLFSILSCEKVFRSAVNNSLESNSLAISLK